MAPFGMALCRRILFCSLTFVWFLVLFFDIRLVYDVTGRIYGAISLRCMQLFHPPFAARCVHTMICDLPMMQKTDSAAPSSPRV
jgi:hypothetical protein